MEQRTLANILNDPTLSDDDHVKILGGEWATVGELRCGCNVSQEDDTMNDYSPPDPYARDLAKLRAASAGKSAPTFAERYAEERTREFEEEAERREEFWDEHPLPRLTTAQARKYAPPDPWSAPLAKLKEEKR